VDFCVLEVDAVWGGYVYVGVVYVGAVEDVEPPPNIATPIVTQIDTTANTTVRYP